MELGKIAWKWELKNLMAISTTDYIWSHLTTGVLAQVVIVLPDMINPPAARLEQNVSICDRTVRQVPSLRDDEEDCVPSCLCETWWFEEDLSSYMAHGCASYVV